MFDFVQSESVNGAKDEAKEGQHNPSEPSGSTEPSGSILDEAKAPEPSGSMLDEAQRVQDEAKAPEDEAKAPEVEAKDPELKLNLEKKDEEAPEPSVEASLLVLEKEAATVSDVQREETRRQEKKDAAIVFARGKSDRARKLAASQHSPFEGNSTAKLIIPNTKVGQGYDPFAPVDKKQLKLLTDWLRRDP